MSFLIVRNHKVKKEDAHTNAQSSVESRSRIKGRRSQAEIQTIVVKSKSQKLPRGARRGHQHSLFSFPLCDLCDLGGEKVFLHLFSGLTQSHADVDLLLTPINRDPHGVPRTMFVHQLVQVLLGFQLVAVNGDNQIAA